MSITEISELLGNVGEFVGSIAVLITLIYLAVQVRQSKELLEKNERIAMSEVYQSRARTRIEYEALMVSSDDLLEAFSEWRESGRNADALDVRTRRRLHHMGNMMAIRADNHLYQYELGLLDDAAARATTNLIEKTFHLWEELDCQIGDRVREWHEEKCAKHQGTSDT